MRVPDLDWPADLFADGVGGAEQATASSPADLYADAPVPPASRPLWLAMRRAWMSRNQATEMPVFAL